MLLCLKCSIIALTSRERCCRAGSEGNALRGLQPGKQQPRVPAMGRGAGGLCRRLPSRSPLQPPAPMHIPPLFKVCGLWNGEFICQEEMEAPQKIPWAASHPALQSSWWAMRFIHVFFLTALAAALEVRLCDLLLRC